MFSAPKHSTSAVVLLTVAGLLGCGGPREKRLVLLNNVNSPYWDTVRSGMQVASRELGLPESGLKASMEVNDGTVEGQISKLRQFASQPDIAVVAISVVDASNSAVADEMRRLQSRGVKVIACDGDVDRSRFRDARKFYVGTENYRAGEQAGICAKGLAPEGGGYVCFVGRTGAQNAIDRMDGVKHGAGDKFKELNRMEDKTDRTAAKENVRNALRNFPDVKLLVGIWSYNAPAIVDVVEEMDRRKAVKIVTFDAEKLAIARMGEGMIDAMVVQNPYEIGYQTVRLMKALAQDDEPIISKMYPDRDSENGDLYDTGLRIVVPSADSPLKKDMFDPGVDFYELEAFKNWMADRQLESS